ncbi:hypothetical protein PLICRDRAFT_54858 [Plicaturopsis crispa FD-325 SS-3]|nr:hypothetical protein PLICRDRAFT_54858 [Plicaturopsis crispa FD-325 SS-3]
MASLGLRVTSWTPRITRSFVNYAAARPPPPPRAPPPASASPAAPVLSTKRRVENIATPHDFLKAIGRSCETLVSIDSWPAFWKTNTHALKKVGLGVQERRYILWCMEKFRAGYAVSDFAHPPKPKKKIRGQGPAVQLGKRIRSRRIKR